MTNTIRDVFKIEGNGIDAIQKWWDIYDELVGVEYTTLELTKTHTRNRFTNGCAWVTEPKDISDWFFILFDIINKTINPKATFKRVKGKCAGDPYCEYVIRIEE